MAYTITGNELNSSAFGSVTTSAITSDDRLEFKVKVDALIKIKHIFSG